MRLAIRWTVGDVSVRGFEALALSIAGARAVFGEAAAYYVCVNTIDLDTARSRVGSVACLTNWIDCSGRLPAWFKDHVDPAMAEGVAWKFAPPALFRDRHVLSLDNDVILWRMPDAIRRWLESPETLLIAEDVHSYYGQFANLCPAEPRNSGMVGIPAGWDTEARLKHLLRNVRLTSEADEQGLQVAMVTAEPHGVVSVRDVSISGYFRPHMLELGSCGAHFVGVNSRHSQSTWQGRSIEHFAHEFFDGKRPEVVRLLKGA